MHFNSNQNRENQNQTSSGYENGRPPIFVRKAVRRTFCQTSVNVNRLKSGPKEVDELRDGAEAGRPQAEKEIPKIVFDRGRILDFEDEEVASDQDHVDGQHDQDRRQALEERVAVAHPSRQRSRQSDEDVQRFEDGKISEEDPTDEGKQLVDQSSLQAVSESFEPND